MSPIPQKRSKIFISYSHQDTEWLRLLKRHLRPLERDYGIELWDDTKIDAGARWKTEIENAISQCRVAVLLISADFLASDFIVNDELQPLLMAAQNDGALILPVIVSPSRFLRVPSLSQFQAVNDVARPLDKLTKGEQEEVFDRVAQRMESVFLDTPSPKTPAPLAPASSMRADTVDEWEAASRRGESLGASANVEPRFLAEFVMNLDGEFKKSGKKNDHYEIRLFIRDAPPDTRKVTYELHESYHQPIREAPKGRREFEEYITSYGDYIVNITLSGDRKTKMNDWLTSALENYYGDGASDEIRQAIKTLEDR